VALAWLHDRPGVTSVILGARTTEQLEQNLQAGDLRLGPAERDRLDQVSRPLSDSYPSGDPGLDQRSREPGPVA
jgi:aryl-alcohol dehydrogenase-like predicted oxidoreductase